MKRPSFKTIAKTYEKKSANVTATCTALNVSRTIFYKWKNRYPKLEALLDEVDESLLDFAESKLLENIQDGDVTSLIFFLKTKGKKRGYVEQVENKVSISPFEELLKSLPDDID